MQKIIFKQLSTKEKKKFIDEHFDYEVDMFFFSLRKRISFKILRGNPEKQNLINMALENFLMHARILLEFFYHERPRNGEKACAHHFFESNNDWKNILPLKTKDIKILEHRVNSEITHLGYNRHYGIPKQKSWNDVQLLHDFMKLVKIFVSNIKNEYLSEELKQKYLLDD